MGRPRFSSSSFNLPSTHTARFRFPSIAHPRRRPPSPRRKKRGKQHHVLVEASGIASNPEPHNKQSSIIRIHNSTSTSPQPLSPDLAHDSSDPSDSTKTKKKKPSLLQTPELHGAASSSSSPFAVVGLESVATRPNLVATKRFSLQRNKLAPPPPTTYLIARRASLPG